jgi:copper chaperone NosL
MTMVDKKYGAEIISTKGKIYKFDDVICMIDFINAANLSENDMEKILVINFEKENDFLDVNQASFYVSDDLHSPMNGNAAAFVNAQQAILFQTGKQGIIMGWKELKEKLK